MKLNQNISPTISSTVDLNVSGSWISSFNLSKQPGGTGYVAWNDWQSSITRAYQSPACNYPGSVQQRNLICARIIVTKMCAERGTAPHCDPFISMFSHDSTHVTPNACLLFVCFSFLAFVPLEHKPILSYLFDIWCFCLFCNLLAVKVKHALPGWLANSSPWAGAAAKKKTAQTNVIIVFIVSFSVSSGYFVAIVVTFSRKCPDIWLAVLYKPFVNIDRCELIS